MLMKKSTLISLDAFSRAQDDVRIKTRSGAIITISCLFVTFILLLFDLTNLHKVVTRPTLVIDRERDLKLNFKIDITFPSMPCDLLNFDIQDDSGALYLDDKIDSNFEKIRLNNVGKPLSSEQLKLIDNVKLDAPLTPNSDDYCGPCYGSREGCCQTCQDVRDAYLEKGWAFFDGKNIEQCEREGFVQLINTHLNEGCRIKGSANLNRINGNIHFAPGQTFQNKNGHFHDTSLYDIHSELNFNHIIHHLSFGDPVKNHYSMKDSINIATSTLNGQQVLPEFNSHDYQFTYFTKIVPTRFEYLNNEFIETTQYSSTYHAKPIAGGKSDFGNFDFFSRGGIPGVFFFLEMSPLKVINHERFKLSYSNFILNCVTAIGGILAVGTVLDKIIYKMQRTIFKSKS